MSDDLFGSERPDDAELDDLERLRAALSLALSEFADEHDVDEDTLSFCLLNSAVTIRSLAYVLMTEKPSEGGLKLELDRFGRAFNDLVRNAKKDAPRIVAELRKSIAEITGQDAPDED